VRVMLLSLIAAVLGVSQATEFECSESNLVTSNSIVCNSDQMPDLCRILSAVNI
jgi:hypothetical protein